MASDVLDDQLSDLDVGGMGCVVDAVAVELKSVSRSWRSKSKILLHTGTQR
jgi:hypothetical protein